MTEECPTPVKLKATILTEQGPIELTKASEQSEDSADMAGSTPNTLSSESQVLEVLDSTALRSAQLG